MRKDGKRLRDVNPMYTIVPYIMCERNDALNSVTVKIPYAPLHSYLNASRKKGEPISHMAVMLAAYVRVLTQYPVLNRFVVNRKVYAHNDIKVSLVVLKPGSESDETMGKIDLALEDTIFDVNRKINEYVEVSRNIEESNSMDKLVSALTRIPGLLRVAVGLLKWMDKHGIMPKSVIDASPFHTSLTISNLASIRTKEIYHHIYNFGTTSLFITMGSPEKTVEMVDGEPKEVRYLPLGVVMDERIASGLEYAQAFRKFAHYMEHPEVLEQPPESIKLDSPFVKKEKKKKKEK